VGTIVEYCPKCGIWRVDILILVCVGASEYKFDRLLKMIDELCDENVFEGKEVIAQIGNTDYIPRNYKSFSLIGRDQFQEYMEKSELIITHAGTGSVIPPLKLGKKVIVVPRLKKFQEHLDDHQLELRDVFTSSGYTLSAENKEDMKVCIQMLEQFKPRKFVTNNYKMNQIVIDFIEKM